MSTTVAYKGNVIHTAEGSTSFTLNTQGNYLDGDVEVVVNESGGGQSSVLVPKSITQNGTYNPASDNADGYSEVSVNVPSSGRGAIVEPDYQGLAYCYITTNGLFRAGSVDRSFYSCYFPVVANHKYFIYLGSTYDNRYRVHFYAGKTISDFQQYIENALSSSLEIYTCTENISGTSDSSDYSKIYSYTPNSNGMIIVVTSNQSTTVPAYCLDTDAAPSGGDAIQYDVGEFFGDYAGGTSSSLTVNYSAESGVKVVLIVLHRSSITLNDNGFQLVNDVKNENHENQKIAIYEKTLSFDVSSGSVTISNPDGDRLCACVMYFDSDVTIGTPTQQSMDSSESKYCYKIQPSPSPRLMVVNNAWAGNGTYTINPMQNIIPKDLFYTGASSATLRLIAWVHQGIKPCEWRASTNAIDDALSYNRLFIYPLTLS